MLDLYRASTLGERRPIDDRERMADMVRDANLVITAWDGEQLVGISRAITTGYMPPTSRIWRCVFPISVRALARS